MSGITFKISEVVAKSVNVNSHDVVKSLYKNESSSVPKPEILMSSLDEKTEFHKPRLSNGFIGSAFQAYNQHHKLVIRPDDVWVAILTQFSKYVELHSEELRSKFVSHQGKKTLEVIIGGTLRCAPYDLFVKRMTELIKTNIVDPTIREWVVPDFSTTTETDQIIGGIALMSINKAYFIYKCCLECGLPAVNLKGKVEDYQEILTRLERLKEFDIDDIMNKWYDKLAPVLRKFIESFDSPDVKWWNRIVNNHGGGSGPSYVSGWITSFIIYDNTDKYVGDNTTIVDWTGKITSDWPIVDTYDVPTGFTSVPIIIEEENGTKHNANFFAGHITSTVSGNQKDDTIVPRLDWVLTL